MMYHTSLLLISNLISIINQKAFLVVIKGLSRNKVCVLKFLYNRTALPLLNLISPAPIWSARMHVSTHKNPFRLYLGWYIKDSCQDWPWHLGVENLSTEIWFQAWQKPSISVFQNEKNVRGRGFSIEMKHLMRIKESKLIEFGISRRYPSHIFYENSSETSSASCFSH